MVPMTIHSRLTLYQMHHRDKVGKNSPMAARRKGFPSPKKECHPRRITGLFPSLRSQPGLGLDQQRDQGHLTQDLAPGIEHISRQNESLSMAPAKRDKKEDSKITQIKVTEATRNRLKDPGMIWSNTTERTNTRTGNLNIKVDTENTVG